MSNELVFGLQVLSAFFLTAFFLRLGKEALFVWMGLLSLLANLFVSKQITLFGLDVTASDVYAVALILTLNLLQEFFGKEEAKKGGQIAIMAQVAFLLFSELHLALTPNSFDTASSAYDLLLGVYPRLLLASCATLYIVQRFDRAFFSFLLLRWKSASFTVRNAVAVAVSQCLDTALFTVLGLYGLVASIFEVFVMSFLIKAILISLLPFFTIHLKRQSHEFSL